MTAAQTCTRWRIRRDGLTHVIEAAHYQATDSGESWLFTDETGSFVALVSRRGATVERIEGDEQ